MGSSSPNFRGENKKYLKPPSSTASLWRIEFQTSQKNSATRRPKSWTVGPTSSWSRIESKVPLVMATFCFEKAYLFLVGGVSPNPSEKYGGKSNWINFPKKSGWKFETIFEVSATQRSFSQGKNLEIQEDLRPMCTSSFSTINLDHLPERAAKNLQKKWQKILGLLLVWAPKTSYFSRMK